MSPLDREYQVAKLLGSLLAGSDCEAFLQSPPPDWLSAEEVEFVRAVCHQRLAFDLYAVVAENGNGGDKIAARGMLALMERG